MVTINEGNYIGNHGINGFYNYELLNFSKILKDGILKNKLTIDCRKPAATRVIGTRTVRLLTLPNTIIQFLKDEFDNKEKIFYYMSCMNPTDCICFELIRKILILWYFNVLKPYL